MCAVNEVWVVFAYADATDVQDVAAFPTRDAAARFAADYARGYKGTVRYEAVQFLEAW